METLPMLYDLLAFFYIVALVAFPVLAVLACVEHAINRDDPFRDLY